MFPPPPHSIDEEEDDDDDEEVEEDEDAEITTPTLSTTLHASSTTASSTAASATLISTGVIYRRLYPTLPPLYDSDDDLQKPVPDSPQLSVTTKYEDVEPDTHFQYETRTENYGDYNGDYETATENKLEDNNTMTVTDFLGYVFFRYSYMSNNACILCFVQCSVKRTMILFLKCQIY